MEQRKIMALGRSSLVISLPKHWVELNGLKQGDLVSLTVNRDRSLGVFPGLEKTRESQKITFTIDPDEKDFIIARSIIACYLNGYFSIRLISKNIFSVAQLKAIRNIVRMLYMQIMESDAKQIYIETLIDESKAQVESSISRMYLISSSMCRDIFTALRTQDIALAKAVYALDDDVDHFSFLLLRLLRNATVDSSLANKLELNPLECLDLQTAVHRIEQVANQATNVAKHIIMLGENHKISQIVLEHMYSAGNKALSLYDAALTGLLSKDIESCNDVIESQSQVEKLDQEIASLTFTKEKVTEIICASCSIRDSIKRMAEHAADICQLTVNQVYEPTA